MKSLQSLFWILLFTTRISAHAIPDQQQTSPSPTKESEIHVDGNTFQRLLNKVDEAVLHSVLYTFTPAIEHQKDHEAAEALYKDDPKLATRIVGLAKRQDDAGGNTTVSTTSTITSTTEASTPPPTTSTVTLPPLASSTETVLVTTPPVSEPQSSTAVIVPGTTQSSVSSNPVPSAPPQSTSQAPATPSIPPSSSSPGNSNGGSGASGSSESSSSTASGSQTTAAPDGDSGTGPDLVLVTSTLPDGQVVTQTSYVNGSPSGTDTHNEGGHQTAPAGALNSSPSSGTTTRPWTFGAVVAVFGSMILL